MAKDRPDPPQEKRPATERREAPIADAASWPVGRAELSALIDVGMSDRVIAAYFGVDESEVAALRGRHGLTAEAARVESMRREARQLAAESRRSADPDEKLRLAEQAFELAQLAEGLERRAAGTATSPATAAHEAPEGETADALLDKAKRWRMRAEEYRTVAEALVHSPSARLTYLHLADSYDALANQTEARARLAGQKRKASG